MTLLYNNQLLQEDQLLLPLTNRAFQYNDGFFETIIIRQGRLSFWEDHVQRMREAAVALQLSLPPYFVSPSFEQKLLELANAQQALEHGRLKLKVWRAGAGLYTPETNGVDWIATVHATKTVTTAPLQLGICQQTRTIFSPLSHFKGPHAPVYVLAGIEKKNFSYDDMLLLSQKGDVAELISSNVFWINDDTLYTPALETGCINGIMRRNILRWCRQNLMKTAEVLTDVSQLHQANAVFAANVTGIRYIAGVGDIPLTIKNPLLDSLNKALFRK